LFLIPEHIPLHDAMDIMAYAAQEGRCSGRPEHISALYHPVASKIGIMPNQYFIPGPVGIVSRSGTLCYEIVGHLDRERYRHNNSGWLGGDRVVGLHFTDVLKEFEKDEATKAVILVGEIGGSSEEEAAAYIASSMSKPVIAYLAGRSAPPGKSMGHAGAIIERGRGTFESKVKALNAAGVEVADLPMDVPPLNQKLSIMAVR
jgi:succinyl-CoA synthetase alpha subunit